MKTRLVFYNGDVLDTELRDLHPPARIEWAAEGSPLREFWLDVDSVNEGAPLYREVARLPKGGA